MWRLAVYEGDLIAAGRFGSAGGVAASNVARWDGAHWYPMGSGVTLARGSSQVLDAIVHHGQLWLSGRFEFEGVPASILRWDGHHWSRADRGVGDFPSSFAEEAGTLFVRVHGGIHRMDGEEWVLWTLGLDGGGPIAFHDGVLFAGGALTDGEWSDSLYHLSSLENGIWRGVGSPIHPRGGLNPELISSIESIGDTLFLTGTHFGVDGEWYALAAYRTEGAWTAMPGLVWDEGPSGNRIVRYRGEIYLGGDFFGTRDGTSTALARWDGSTWQPVEEGVRSGDHWSWAVVSDLLEFRGELIIAGRFVGGGGVSSRGLLRWDGTKLLALGEGQGIERARVHDIVSFQGQTIVGGSFTVRDGGREISNLAAWDQQGWKPLGRGVDGIVYALLVDDGALLVAGSFRAAGGKPASGIAQWDGQEWSPLGFGLEGGHPVFFGVRALAKVDGILVAGGHFSNSGEDPTASVAFWDGKRWQSLGSGLSSRKYPTVNSLALYDGDLYAGGVFEKSGSTSLPNLARWDGKSWLRVDPGFTGQVSDLTVFGNELIIGGDFGRSVSGNVVRWNGEQMTALPPDGPGRVTSLAVLDGYLYAGGHNYQSDGTPGASVRRWSGQNHWEALDTGATSQVSTLHPTRNGELWLGGDFTTAGAVPSYYIARWREEQPAVRLTSLEVEQENRAMEVIWHTTAENGTGFQLYRRSPSSREARLNSMVIPSQGNSGGGYRFVDTSPPEDTTVSYRLGYERDDGWELQPSPWTIWPYDPTVEDPVDEPPTEPQLGHTRLWIAGPHPTNRDLEIGFEVVQPGEVLVRAYDTSGRRRATILRAQRPSGVHSVSWNQSDDTGHPLPAGIYWVRLVTGAESKSVAVVRLH